MFPCYLMKYEETYQRQKTTRATRSKSNLPSWTDNPHCNNDKQEGPSDSNYADIKG
jgi:replication initiation and membrane attachment protein DnaB